MGLTNFPNGVTSFGVPVLPLNGFATQGNVWYVKPSNGSDGNSGKSPAKAFKTLAQAYSKCTANQNDIVFLIAESNTAASTTDYLSATLTWGKDLTHLIGVSAPCAVSQRARIAQLSTATAVSPLLDVTANGCILSNFQIFHGVNDATSLVNVRVTGDRNYFHNVHIAGIGHATMVAAGAASLKIDGGDENVFKECVIGLDTITRDNATNGEIWFDGGATRNKFEDCLIQGYISNASYVSVTVNDSTAIDRWTWFKRCVFLTESVNDTVAQTSVFSIPAMSQGYIVLDQSTVGAATGTPDWDSNNRGRIRNNMVAAAASAAGGLFTAQ